MNLTTADVSDHEDVVILLNAEHVVFKQKASLVLTKV